MDIRLKNKKKGWKNIVITIIYLVLTMALLTQSNPIIISFIIIGMLTIQLLGKEIKLLFATMSLNEFINQMNEGIDEEEIKNNIKEYPQILRLSDTFNEDILNVLNKAQQNKNERFLEEKNIENLIYNVVNNLDKPVKELKKEIENLNIDNIEEKIKELQCEEEIVEKLVIDVFKLSKAMNINLPIKRKEKDLNYILRQICGEFSVNIEESKLKYNIDIDKTKFNYGIDIEKFCEVIEILLENVEKHSLENSRVYIKSIVENNIYKIQIKNISNERLNIKVQELKKIVEEKNDFKVTGIDLKYCEKLIKAMKGNFEIGIDGDLFKVNISFVKGGLNSDIE